jgi:hypothetical protein
MPQQYVREAIEDTMMDIAARMAKPLAAERWAIRPPKSATWWPSWCHNRRWRPNAHEIVVLAGQVRRRAAPPRCMVM